jgi:signal transduction histidine kinase
VVRRRESVAITLAALLVTLVPIAAKGPPPEAGAAVGDLFLVGAGLSLLLWRRSALWTVLVGGGCLLVAGATAADDPDLAILVCTALAAVAGNGFSGRHAWTSAAGVAAWLAGMYLVTGERDIGLVMLTVPGFLAGTAFRLRRETSEELAVRGQELEEEREVFALLAVRNERARIAAELHDIIGHSLSVMVVQAAAGQRLVQRDSEAVGEVLDAIAESARQGREDLHRLVDLLGGEEVAGPDLSLVDEVVARAARSGLSVTCRFEGDRDGVPAALAELAFRVVREALTNALRYAPGSAVHVLLRGEGRSLEVRVDNEASTTPAPGIIGTGQGLRGLRDRVEELGGRFSAGATTEGGWAVEALLRAPA